MLLTTYFHAFNLQKFNHIVVKGISADKTYQDIYTHLMVLKGQCGQKHCKTYCLNCS